MTLEVYIAGTSWGYLLHGAPAGDDCRPPVTTLASTFTFTDSDGFDVFVYRWTSTEPAEAVVQIAHGGVERGPVPLWIRWAAFWGHLVGGQ